MLGYIAIAIGASIAVGQHIYERRLEKKFYKVCEEHRAVSSRLIATLNTEEARTILKNL